MATIFLTRDYAAVVDDADYEWLRQWKWQAQTQPSRSSAVYAVRRKLTSEDPRRPKVYMHREILKLYDPDLEVDHRDHNGLNNHRDNLRVVNASANLQNRGMPNGASDYLGVNKDGDRYQARIGYGTIRIYIGRFDTAEQAARAYDAKARELYGPDALVNFPEPRQPAPADPAEHEIPF